MMVYLRALVVCIALFCVYSLEAKQTVCLNMIVKNETAVIKRCLDSVKPMIDYWVISDTGSNDGSQEMIKEHMKDIPGELHENPWVNFEHNRNKALELAKDKGDYVLFIDADEYFVYEPDFALPPLEKDCYYMNMSNGFLNTKKIHLINNHLGWEWKGVLHEALIPKPENQFRSSAVINRIKKIFTNEGARSKNPDKYKHDAELLEAALKTEPNNRRYVFYLARSYETAGDLESALKNYEKRFAMRGWDEEAFESALAVGILREKLKFPSDKVVEAYANAYKFRPSRVEPLFYLAAYLRQQQEYPRAYQVAKIGVSVPLSTDVLFVQPWIYDYGMALELSACSYWVGRYEECQQLSQSLLKNENVSPENRKVVQKNLEYANLKLFSEIVP